MWYFEKAVEVAVWIDKHNFTAVAHEIIVVFSRLVAKRNIHLAGKIEDIDVLASYPEIVLAKIFYVSAEFFRRIPSRVDGNHYHLHSVGSFGVLQQALELANACKSKRTDVGAIGIAEEDYRPTAGKITFCEWLAVMITQRKILDAARHIINKHAVFPELLVGHHRRRQHAMYEQAKQQRHKCAEAEHRIGDIPFHQDLPIKSSSITDSDQSAVQ